MNLAKYIDRQRSVRSVFTASTFLPTERKLIDGLLEWKNKNL